MIAARRVLRFVEWSLIVVFSLVLLGFLIDLPSARQASPCLPNDPGRCYPWGAEGPAAGDWKYASKQNYLTSSIFGAVVVSATLLAAFIVSPQWRIWVLLAGIASGYAGNFLLPRLMA